MRNIPKTAGAGLSRRRFLRWSGAGVLAGALGGTDVLLAEDVAAPAPLSREWFLPHLGSRFTVISSTPVDLELIDVSAARRCVAPATVYTCFSLTFSAPSGTGIFSEIHRLRHPALGELELFISPVGLAAKDGSLRFETVFSQGIT